MKLIPVFRCILPSYDQFSNLVVLPLCRKILTDTARKTLEHEHTRREQLSGGVEKHRHPFLFVA